MKNTVMLASAPSGLAPRLAATLGSDGRYMSIAKGPIAVSSPRTIALRANEGRMARGKPSTRDLIGERTTVAESASRLHGKPRPRAARARGRPRLAVQAILKLG